MRLSSWKAALPLAIIAAVAGPAVAQAQSEGSANSALSGWTFSAAPYTLHFSKAEKEHDFEPDNPKHSYVWLLAAEKRLSQRNFAGFAWFSNSFGQPTQYLYYGWRFEPISSLPQLYLKLSAGVIHGYKEPFHKKIPFNSRSGWGGNGYTSSRLAVLARSSPAGERTGHRWADVSVQLHLQVNRF